MLKTRPKIDFLLDSGAYSAFTTGAVINIDDYIAFIRANDAHVVKSVNLDVIIPEDPEIAAAASMKNYQYMLDQGVDALPVFHAREKMKWLDMMVDRTKYIALAATSIATINESHHWYDLCWSYLTDRHGNPVVELHCLGDTSLYTIFNYPWHSMDSAAWAMQGSRGAKVSLNGRLYNFRSMKASGRGDMIREDDCPATRESWEKGFRDIGFDPEALFKGTFNPSELAMIRSCIVAKRFLQLEAQTAGLSQFKSAPTFVNGKKQQEGGTPKVGPTKMYFVISPKAPHHLPVMAALGIKRILISYHYILGARRNYEEMFVPFCYDPIGMCESHEELKPFWEALQKVMLPGAIPTY